MAVTGAGVSSGYDRLKELKAFDESKAGVKGLVDAGVEKIPRFFIRPPDEDVEVLDSSQAGLQIPVVDLADVENSRIPREEIGEAVREAAVRWGFFQVVNHRIPMSVLEEMMEGCRRFNEEDDEVKREFYTWESTKKALFSSNFDLYKSPAANWRDTLFCVMAPDRPNPDELPPPCR